MEYLASKDLQKFAQQTVEAISSVLNMQVTVVDSEMKRIAGTGMFSVDINKNLSPSFAFKEVIGGGESCFIKQPGNDAYCENCLERDTCKEKATLLTPVKINNKIVGGIGLFAMTEREKKQLTKNVDNYTKFMEKMADLLSTKIKNSLESNRILVLANNLNAIIDSYPHGIISLNSLGKVIHFNRNAELILNIPSNSILNKQYSEKISCPLLENALSKGSSYQSVHEAFKVNSKSIELILSIQPIFNKNVLEEIVCFFQKYSPNNKIGADIHDNVKYSFNNIKGHSSEIKEVIKLVRRILPSSNSTVLISGESGTGKELFAKAIHYTSNRNNYPFVAINCSAIPDALLESELFGYSKGAFTNANSKGKIGKFELANKGTVFLDEIGDMPINLQAKLLRVLQEKIIERLGDTKSINIDIRIIAATNKNLKELIKKGLFREDLYYRINVIPVHLPPLRYRKADIPVLAKHFLSKYDSLLLKGILGFLPETLTILNEYDWPGNIRELENAIEYAVNMENTDFVRPQSLPNNIVEKSKYYSTDFIDTDTKCLKACSSEIERLKIKELISMHGSSTEAKKIIAEKLGISLSTLYRKMK